jgi:hypothetical protein
VGLYSIPFTPSLFSGAYVLTSDVFDTSIDPETLWEIDPAQAISLEVARSVR